MTEKQHIAEALRVLAERCPRLVRLCYWAGTAAVAVEELGHRKSFDLDFHTREALEDVRPILAELQAAFRERVEVVESPDEFGSGFRILLTLPSGPKITLEVLSNFESVPDADLVESQTSRAFQRVTLRRYLADKIQYVVERAEARDLLDIGAVLRRHPEWESFAKDLLRAQDAILVVERSLAWTDDAIEKDLAAYEDVRSGDAVVVRDLLLRWLEEIPPAADAR